MVWHLRHLLPLMAAGLLLGACECEQIDYSAPLQVDVIAGEDLPLPEGSYALVVLADGVEWRVECGSTAAFEDEFDSSNCEPSVVAGEAGGQSLAVFLDRERIRMLAQRYDDPDTLGIEQLEVRVLRDEIELTSEQYTPVYEEHRSGPRSCGVTEIAPQQTLELPPE